MITEQQRSIRGIMISEQPSLTIPDYLIYLRGLDDSAFITLISAFADNKIAALQASIQSRQNDIMLIQQEIDSLTQSISFFTLEE